ncbi:multicopper oxidase domain-containing protein [Tessaracoccus oleiagri]|uniref:Multicopper oxidase n=1 Tax=Tessaracoccus oleiagri TaxID=686624 RepID=A0A1G9HFB2_9ACTN|nr:multicopper oxidase domain-containing protein [Tessaracoccus oleiagri]SDL11559.1 Multicopper oxidase [Tessaracoccus oleiagri]
MQFSRRSFFTYSAGGALALVVVDPLTGAHVALADALPGGTLAAADIRQFASPLLVPPTMPRTRRARAGGGFVDEYVISVRQFAQQLLPPELPPTVVWGYGPAAGGAGRSGHSAPSMTIEAEHGVPVRVRWVNELVDESGGYLPHLLPVDPTLHWANPSRRPGADGVARTDVRPDYTGLSYVPPSEFTDPETQYTTYTGPVPMVVHLHGAMGMGDESDGYPEAWYLPAAADLPADHASHGSWYAYFAEKSRVRFGVPWRPGEQVAHYPNDNRDSTLWFHDHALGITRLNVYAGPAGFYLLRGGEHGEQRILDRRTGRPAVLPSPAPGTAPGNGSRPTYEIPLAIQDRSFNADGSLFYPDTRAFFDGYPGPYAPETAIAPVWNPEFFGNTLIVNGRTWPFHEVEQRRYRLRFLNGCGSRFLILDFGDLPGVRVHRIGNDGGFPPEAHDLAEDGLRLLLAPAERADLVVDFTKVPLGRHVLVNLGPDEPFGGGEPGVDFEPADPATTGRVMAFDVVPARGRDLSTPGEFLVLPERAPFDGEVRIRRLALLEHMHDIADHEVEEGEAPAAAMLGVVEGDPRTRATARALTWADPVTENPEVGATEVWEFYNLTADAHPVHVHEAPFEVLDRRRIEVEEREYVVGIGPSLGPVPGGDRGLKDTVISYPGTVTSIRLTFRNPGQFVWHCHVLEHEDNEMMRPYRVGPVQPGQPEGGTHPH